MKESLDTLLKECELLHGHMCAGQLLGARMALLGCREIGIDDPRGADRKKLIVWVEIDRCMTDAISAVTGVRLGKRSLKYIDYGKVAATFLNTQLNRAVRIVALESRRALADQRFSDTSHMSCCICGCQTPSIWMAIMTGFMKDSLCTQRYAPHWS